jgi:hypothetical protein
LRINYSILIGIVTYILRKMLQNIKVFVNLDTVNIINLNYENVNCKQKIIKI